MIKILVLLLTAVSVRVASRPAVVSQQNTSANVADRTVNATQKSEVISVGNIEALDYDLRNSSSLNTNHEDTISITMSPCPESCHCYAEIIAHCGSTTINEFPCDEKVSDFTSDYVNAFPQNVQSIYLNFNVVENIPRNCLTSSGKNLIALSLRSNLINNLEVEAFNGLNKLEHLDLQENKITSITFRNQTESANKSVSVFRSLRHSLNSLQLSFNMIENISSEAFAGFEKLELLSLSHNEISWISLTAFKDLSSLRILNLRGNPLSQVTKSQISDILSWFSQPKLSYSDNIATASVKLSRNSECGSFLSSSGDDISLRKKRQAELFSDYYVDEEINQQENPNLKLDTLQTLDLGELNLTSVPENLPNSLKILFLDKNSISELFIDSLEKLNVLEAFYLSHNRISRLTDGVFAFLQNLNILDLSNNAIDLVSPNAFCGLQNLEILRMYKNPNLRELPEKVFRHTKSLRLLYLQECGLETLPAGPWVYRIRVAWLYGNPLRCDCGTIVPLLVALKYKTQSNNKRLLLDPYKKTSIDDLDVSEDMKKENTFCYSPPYYQERRVINLRLNELQCSLEEWKKILVHRRLSVTMFYSAYPNDDPLSSSTSITASAQSPDNDTTHLETKDHNYLNSLLSDYGLNKDTYAELDESVSDILKNASFDTYYDGTSDLLSDNDEERNDFQSSVKKDDVFQYYDNDYGVDDTDSTISSFQTETNSTEDLNQTSSANTEWLIEIAASAEVIDAMAPSSGIQNENFVPGDIVAPNKDEIESTSSNITSITNPTDSNHSNAFLVATFDINDEYEDQYWEEYDKQYFTGDVKQQLNLSQVDSDRHREPKNLSTDLNEPFTDFESDYSSWLDADQWTSLKDYLGTLDMYQEFDSYYYSNDDTESEYGDLFSQLLNGTNKLSQFWSND